MVDAARNLRQSAILCSPRLERQLLESDARLALGPVADGVTPAAAFVDLIAQDHARIVGGDFVDADLVAGLQSRAFGRPARCEARDAPAGGLRVLLRFPVARDTTPGETT